MECLLLQEILKRPDASGILVPRFYILNQLSRMRNRMTKIKIIRKACIEKLLRCPQCSVVNFFLEDGAINKTKFSDGTYGFTEVVDCHRAIAARYRCPSNQFIGALLGKLSSVSAQIRRLQYTNPADCHMKERYRRVKVLDIRIEGGQSRANMRNRLTLPSGELSYRNPLRVTIPQCQNPPNEQAGQRSIQRRGSDEAHERGATARAQHATAATPYRPSKGKESWRRSSGSEARRRAGRLERDFRSSATSLSVGEALAFRAPDRFGGAFGIGNTESGTLIVAKIELAQIPLQVFGTDVMIRSVNAALKDREVVFGGIRARVAPDVLFNRVVDRLVACEASAKPDIDRTAIGAEVAILGNRIREDRLQRSCGHVGDVVRTHLAAALDQRHYGLLVRDRSCVSAVCSFAADVCFVALNKLAFTAEWAGINRAHGFANAVRHEPRGLVSHSERAVQLVRRHAFFAAADKAKRERPFVQRDMARLHDGAGRYRERAVARIAMNEAGAMRLAVEAVDLLNLAAVRAKGSVRPADRLEMLPRFGFVGKDGIGQVHGGLSTAADTTPSVNLRQRDNCPYEDRLRLLEDVVERHATALEQIAIQSRGAHKIN